MLLNGQVAQPMIAPSLTKTSERITAVYIARRNHNRFSCPGLAQRQPLGCTLQVNAGGVHASSQGHRSGRFASHSAVLSTRQAGRGEVDQCRPRSATRIRRIHPSLSAGLFPSPSSVVHRSIHAQMVDGNMFCYFDILFLRGDRKSLHLMQTCPRCSHCRMYLR